MEDKVQQDPLVQEIDLIGQVDSALLETNDTELENEVSDSPIEEIPTDEPEEITAAEAVLSDIPLVQPEASALVTLVCDVCIEKNLTERCTIECMRCNELFCLHYASNVDACYCVNCMSDVNVTKQVITKTYESTNAEGEKTFYRRRARQITIGGLDWLFAQRRIPEYSDAELDLAIEYHRERLNLLLGENERRRTEKMHRYAGVKVVLPSTNGTATTTTTTVKKTRIISKNKQQEQLAALLKSLQAQGMSVAAIAAALGGKK
jgi:hypothetical protein